MHNFVPSLDTAKKHCETVYHWIGGQTEDGPHTKNARWQLTVVSEECACRALKDVHSTCVVRQTTLKVCPCIYITFPDR